MPSYKSERRNTWYCSFYFTDWRGIRKKKKKEGFRTKKEAQEWERKFLEEYAETPDIPFDTLAKAYLADSKRRIKATTYKTRRILVNHHILPFFKEMCINNINKRNINEWKASLVQKELTPAYIKEIYWHLKSIFNFAIENYNLLRNPCGKLTRTNKTEKKIQYWTIDEFRTFAAYNRLPQYIVLFYLLFWTGMRIGEATALTWDDIDLETGTISITKTYIKLYGEKIITPPKTYTSNRQIVIPYFIIHMLQDYKRISKYSGSHLFEASRSSIRRKFERDTVKANVKKIRIHDLRHSHASMLINAGFTPIEVADRLGHSSAAITLRVYSHFYTHRRAEIADRIAQII